jgi:hypothetical protein
MHALTEGLILPAILSSAGQAITNDGSFKEENMVLYRTVFQAKFGKASQVVAEFKKFTKIFPEEQVKAMQVRILTDISGPFDTVVMETTHASLAAVEQFRNAMFANPDMAQDMSSSSDLIEGGRNEYYTIEL